MSFLADNGDFGGPPRPVRHDNIFVMETGELAVEIYFETRSHVGSRKQWMARLPPRLPLQLSTTP